MVDPYLNRILGCMVGSAVGDSLGAVVEFRSAADVEAITGGDWVDDLLPFSDEHHTTHPLGLWEPCPPRGTATDDTRLNHLFVDCVCRNGGFVNSQLLAIEQMERYRDRELFYDPRHGELAERQFRRICERACAYLGMTATPSGTPGWVVRAAGNGRPSLIGLISLAFVGLLHPDEPEAAYRHAFELAYYDVGYGRDATAMLAAMVASAAGGQADAREMIEIGLRTDPLGYGKRIMTERVERLIEVADEADDDRQLIDALAREVAGLHPFDPIDVLGVPVAAAWYAGGDPVQTIILAANDRDVDEQGRLVGIRDVDCTAGVAGALVGALAGPDAFPEDWLADTVAANREVYNIDIEANARRLFDTCRATEPQ